MPDDPEVLAAIEASLPAEAASGPRMPGPAERDALAEPGPATFRPRPDLGGRILREAVSGSNVRAMTTFVLVHGAWGGSYGFKYVRGPLREAGHEVFTPSLTGIGERVHLASPQVNLTTHVTDVVNTILYEDLTDIVLLGYSYGGMVVTGALEHVADRVAHLVYLDAFKPADGQSLRDLTGAPYQARGDRAGRPVAGRAAAPAAGGRGRRSTGSAPPLLAPGRLLHRAGPAAASRSRTSRSPAPTSRPCGSRGRRRAPGHSAFWRAAEHAKSDPAWRYREIDTDHMIPINRPAELVELLLELAWAAAGLAAAGAVASAASWPDP